MADIIEQAVYGAVVGASLGAPHKGRHEWQKLPFYDPIPVRMAQSDWLDAWIVAADHLSEGRPAETVFTAYADHWRCQRGETAFGLANVAAGISQPMAGAWKNPLPEGSNGFARAVFWGLAFHGNPDEAAEAAWNDVTLDHSGSGAWLPTALARMVATAHPGATPGEVLRAGLDIIPKECRFLGAISVITPQLGKPDSGLDIRAHLPKQIGSPAEEEAVLTMAWIAAGLLHGNGDFGKTLLTGVGFGGESEQVGVALGALGALLSGQTPHEWQKPLGRSYIAGSALKGVDPPQTIHQFSEIVEAAYKNHGAAIPVPVIPEPVPEPESEPAPEPEAEVSADAEAAEGAPEEESTPEEVVEPVQQELEEAPVEPEPVAEPIPDFPGDPSAALIKLIQGPALRTTSWTEDVKTEVTYFEGLPVTGDHVVQAGVTFQLTEGEEKRMTPAIDAPEGWSVSHRFEEFRLRPDSPTSFPLILTPPSTAQLSDSQATLRIGRGRPKISLPAAQLWYRSGPFDNTEGKGFNYTYPAERSQKLDDVFNGRSGLAEQWKPLVTNGRTFDLEQYCNGAPGTMLIWAGLVLPEGRLKIMAASSMGAVVFINGERLLGYHHNHQVWPDFKEPYVGEFESKGMTTVLIKVLRGKNPLQPVTIAFKDASGAPVEPSAWSEMTP